MFNKLTSRLLLVISLFVFSASQQVFSADATIKKPVADKTMTKPAVDKATKKSSSAADKKMKKASATITKINLNTATNEQLATIKGIGVKKAQAIIDYRKEHGKFASLDDLINVKGIGEGTLKKIAPLLKL